MEKVGTVEGEKGTMNYNELFKSTNGVYARLQDDLSRKIYKDRVMNSLTYDYSFITDMMDDKFDAIDWLQQQLDQYITEGREIVLDGAGYYGKSIAMTLKSYPWVCICDRSSSEKDIFGFQVCSRNEAIEKYPNAVFVISSMTYCGEIKKEYIANGITDIINFGSYLNEKNKENEKQYYDVLPFSNDEVIADVGCFDCASMFRYFKYANKQYKKIFSFEPEPTQFLNCRKIVEGSGYKNWEVYNYGVWNEQGKLHFKCNSSGSFICEDGDVEVKVVCLDDFFENREKPTFIKMDIEGVEMRALEGASEIIKKYRPKLAICVYHKLEDIFEIPEYILSLNPSYKLYLRHYTNRVNETVLYAV